MAHKVYFIQLDGRWAGMPTRHPVGKYHIADGSRIAKSEHPAACRMIESYFNQHRYIPAGYCKLTLKLIKWWNTFVCKLSDINPSLINLHVSTYVPNPNYDEHYVTLPDWRIDDDLILLLTAATNKS